jgi:hypothetical protein
MRRRVVLVGASGAFGARLARMLAHWDDVDLVLAARHLEPLQRLLLELQDEHCRARLEVAAFDRERPADLPVLRPWAVVDAAGPFQASDFRLPEAVIAAGAHYVDIADGRDFVSAFPRALDTAAKAAGVLAVTGASSTPALSNAALEVITAEWRGVDSVVVAISAGAKAPRGLSVLRAILSYVGRPIRIFLGQRWTTRPGWSGLRQVSFPGLGRRWVSLCETPDLDLIPQRAAVKAAAVFFAGVELAAMQIGLWLLSWIVRLHLVRDLQLLARPLRALAGLFAHLGSDRGGMVVLARGEGPQGEARSVRWALVADENAGPSVPVAAAAAVLRGLRDGHITARGAQACVGLLGLDDIVAELHPLPIRTRTDSWASDEAVLFRRVLGARFDALPPAVARVHGGHANRALRGRGRARGGRSPLMWLGRRLLGLPQPGAYPEIAVDIAIDPGGETWTRNFGVTHFTSRLCVGADPGQFVERFGPLRFTFEVDPTTAGFRWRFVGWRLGGLPLPLGLAPQIRARAFARDDGYQFRVVTAHPWLGVLFAYAGRLG